MAAERESYPRVDSIRAIAALSVLGFHLTLAFAHNNYPTKALRPLGVHLDIGVTIFFLISAFLLYRPYVAAQVLGRPGPALLPYAVRRVARIVPAYWVAATIFGIVFAQHYLWNLEGFARFYGFAQIYSARTAIAGLGVSWSLCVEVVLYAALPLFAWLGLRLGARAGIAPLRAHTLLVCALFVLGIAYQEILLAHRDPNLYTGPTAMWYLPFPAFLDQFALGMGLAVWSVAAATGRPRARRAQEWIAAHASLPGFAAIALFVGLSLALGLKGLPLSGMSSFDWMARHEGYALVALLLLVPAVLPGPSHGVVQRVLAWRPLRLAGVVSYGIYLYHALVAHELEVATRGTFLHPDKLPSEVAFTVLTVAGVILAGTVSYLVIERPAQVFARRLRRSKPPAIGVEAPAPAPTGG